MSQFKDALDHNKISGAIAVLGAPKRLAAIDEKAAADATGILNNPVSVTARHQDKALIMHNILKRQGC